MLNVVFVELLITAIASSNVGFGNGSEALDNEDRNFIKMIVGGLEAQPHAYPWQAAMTIGNEWAYCGGTIICPKFVMTAYHCVSTIDHKTHGIVVGIHNKNEIKDRNIRKHAIAQIIPHPKAPCVHQRFDFALLELKENIQFGTDATPIYLPSASDIKRLTHTSRLVVSGWGMADNRVYPIKLRAVTLNHLGGKKCPLSNWEETPDKICAGINGGRKDACVGDSGGTPFGLVFDSDIDGVFSCADIVWNLS